MPGDLMATGANPGTTYTADSGPYHEDREVTVTGSPGPQMFRVYNAMYDTTGGVWKLPVGGSGLAYATVQNPDGSIHYLVSPGTRQWTNSEWLGSGNNTVYNAVDFGMVPTTINPTFDNGPALQNVFVTVARAGGGTIVIPSGKYNFLTGISHTALVEEDSGILIVGTGGGAELYANFGASPPSNTLISLTDFGSTGNGVRFRNLRITYSATTTVGPAVQLAQCANISFEQVFFADCPGALVDNNESGQCGLINCTIEYTALNNGQTMVVLSGSEDYVHNCVIRQTPLSGPGPTHCTGIEVQSASRVYVTNTQISEFDTGISVVGGGPAANPVTAHFSNIDCEANVTAVSIVASSGTALINQLFFESCAFSLTTDSSSHTPGTVIGTLGATNGTVTDIHFTDCMWYNWNGSGLAIYSGRDIFLIGCRFAACGLSAPIGAQAGGLAISGTPENVIVTGCNFFGDCPQGNGTQPFAIVITNVVNKCWIRGCNLLGNASGPIYLLNPGTKLEITDCAGYNDQGLVLTPNPPGAPPSVTFQNTSAWTNAPNGWFGPIAFYVWSGGTGHITIDGVQTTLASGGFTLSPGESAQIAVAGSPLFLAVGK
jgi:hypothetical protein